MKNIFILTVFSMLALTSCKKDFTCQCDNKGTYSYEEPVLDYYGDYMYDNFGNIITETVTGTTTFEPTSSTINGTESKAKKACEDQGFSSSNENSYNGTDTYSKTCEIK